MEFRFDEIMRSNLDNDNSYVDHITCSHGSKVPIPVI